MRRFALMVVLGTLLSPAALRAATTLAQGEAVILSFNQSTGVFKWAPLVDLTAGTTVSITDMGLPGTGSASYPTFPNSAVISDGQLTISFAANVARGTIFTVTLVAGSSPSVTMLRDSDSASFTSQITFTGWTGGTALTPLGDSLMIYQGTLSSSTSFVFVYAVSGASGSATNGGFLLSSGNNTGITATVLPASSTVGVNAIGFGGFTTTQDSRLAYTGAVTATDKAGWLARVVSTSNWQFNVGTAPTPSFGTTLNITVPSPVVTTPTSTAITATTATLGGNVTSDNGVSITERGVVYSANGTNSDPTIGGGGVTKVTTSGTTGVFTIDVTGLTGATAYAYKAYATNASGTTYTTLGTFTTETAGYVYVIGTPAAQFNTGTLSFTVPAGTNRLLLVGASDSGASSVSTVTFGASALTKHLELSDNAAVDSFWYLPMGTSASPTTATITMTTATTDRKILSALVFENVDQSNPITTPANLSAKGSTATSSLTATSSVGDMVVDLFDTFSGGTQSVNTPNSGQTLRTNVGGSLGTGKGTWTTSTKPGAGSVTTGWSYTASGGAYIQLAVNVHRLTTSAPTVTTATQSNVAATSATLGGNVTSDGGASVTERGIVWATTANPTTADTKVSNGSGTGSFSTTVTGLTSNATIHVRAYAINSVGTSYGSDVSFTTPALDTTKPTVASVVRANSAASALAAGTTSVTFRVTYSEAVTGVIPANFQVEGVNGGTVTGTIGTISTVSSSVYDVPVTITGGSGDFRLKVVN